MPASQTNFYTALGAMLDHPELLTEVSREGISKEEFKEACSKYTDVSDKDIDDLTRNFDNIKAFYMGALTKPRC